VELAFSAYPDFPWLTEESLQKANDLGGTNYIPAFGSWKGNLLRRIVGWKAARTLNARYHRAVGRIRTLGTQQ
jgi:hypothetical protein